MLRTVKKVGYLNGYRLKLLFDNGKVKVVDLAGMMKKAKNMFLPLVDIDYFKQVKCDGNTIYWPNGIDICPDLLYRTGEGFAKPTQTRKKKINKRTSITRIRRKPRTKNRV